jgi:hypothetical protein
MDAKSHVDLTCTKQCLMEMLRIRLHIGPVVKPACYGNQEHNCRHLAQWVFFVGTQACLGTKSCQEAVHVRIRVIGRDSPLQIVDLLDLCMYGKKLSFGCGELFVAPLALSNIEWCGAASARHTLRTPLPLKCSVI